MAENTDEKVLDEKDESDDIEEEKSEGEDDAPIRKSAAFFAQRRIIEKQKKEIEQLKEDDVELTSSARDAIRKELSPVIDTMRKQADDLEIREHIARHPEDEKIEKAIRRRAEAWPTVPISEIAKTIKFGTEQKQREDKKKEVVEKSEGKKLGGSGARAEEPSLPTQADHAEIYKRMRRGEELNLETGEWQRAKNR